jgi:hypothetical protein
MRNAIALAFATVTLCGLVGCVHDSYTVIPGAGGSKDSIAVDSRECRIKIVKEWVGRNPLGLAVFFEPDYDAKAAIEECMKAKGYQANADNAP